MGYGGLKEGYAHWPAAKTAAETGAVISVPEPPTVEGAAEYQAGEKESATETVTVPVPSVAGTAELV